MSTLSTTTTKSSTSPSHSWDKAWRKKHVPRERIASLAEDLRTAGKRIATLNGSFDLLHAGHLHILFEASCQADVLIVALNTDSSIRSYKGPKRPLIPLIERQQMMAALEFVNYVTEFDDPDPCPILADIRPDVHVNGSEYGPDCVEAPLIKQQGGRVHIVSLVPGLSTSNIVSKLCDC